MPDTRDLLAREEQAWRELPVEEYDRTICGLLTEASIDLTRATLRRRNPLLTESRACCAEKLLPMISSGDPPAAVLFIACWLQLSEAVRLGPDSVSESAPLPEGVVLPDGADPSSIRDPALREQAILASEDHGKEIQRWNAKQRAIGHMLRLLALLRAARTGQGEIHGDLVFAMSLAPGLPPQVRSRLDELR